MLKRMFILLAVFAFMLGAAEKEFVLVDNGRPVASIEKITGMTEETDKALSDFQHDLKKVCGTVLPIVEKGEKSSGNLIRFELRKDNNVSTNDTYSLLFPNETEMRIICTQASLRWALNYILEQYAGVRWLFPEKCGMSYTPLKRVAVLQRDVKQTPSFPLGRSIYFSTNEWMRHTSAKHGLDGGHLQLLYFFPVKKYKKEGWPEAIMPVHNGKKLTAPPKSASPDFPNAYWQPCYTNPATAQIAADNAIEFLRENPGHSKGLSMGVNDCGGFCECEECRKIGKSEAYYTWVNRVAGQVTKTYPDVMFIAMAYDGVSDPPSFKLHKNVIVILTLDLYACVDREVRALQKQTIARWTEKASPLGVWDYFWGYGYIAPRLYTKIHTSMLRYLYKHNCRYYFAENESFDAKEGPKNYLCGKLLWDINADENKLLSEWYEKCVGKSAAPYLKQYYDKWEEFYKGDTVRQTPWFRSRYATYMSYYDPSVIYALKPGELAGYRALMEKVVSFAGTQQEKERAQLLMRHFEYLEAQAKLAGAEVIPPDMKLTNVSESIDILNNIASLDRYVIQKKRISEEMKNDPLMGPVYKRNSNIVGLDDDGTNGIMNQLMMATEFISDPEVKKAVKAIAGNIKLPEIVRMTAEVFGNDGKGQKNLFTNGSLEEENIRGHFMTWMCNAKTVRTSEMSADGKYSFKITPSGWSTAALREKADPDSVYLIRFQLMLPKHVEGAYIQYALYATKQGNNLQWRQLPKIQPPANQWVTYTAYAATPKDTDGIVCYIFFEGFGTSGASAYIDNVKLYQIK